MWSIENQTPFGAFGYFVRDKKGAEFWTVAIRAHFYVLDNGQTELCDEQLAPQLSPSYALPQAGEPIRADDARELLIEPDFAPFRPYPDVFLTGFAQGERRKPLLKQVFGFQLGNLQKQAEAHGVRRMRKTSGGWRLIREDMLLEPVPVRWTEALGGVDPFADGEINLESVLKHYILLQILRSMKRIEARRRNASAL